MRRQALVQARIDAVVAGLGVADGVTVPARLTERVTRRLADTPTARWDAVLRKIAEADREA
jgi:hypothetical protein